MGGGSKEDGVSGDVIIQITNRIEKIEVTIQMLTKSIEELKQSKG